MGKAEIFQKMQELAVVQVSLRRRLQEITKAKVEDMLAGKLASVEDLERKEEEVAKQLEDLEDELDDMDAKYGREYQLQRRKELILKGEKVRTSAKLVGKKVHVIFDGVKESEGWYMDQETYHAIPNLETATADDFRKFGTLEPAPSDFSWEKAE